MAEDNFSIKKATKILSEGKDYEEYLFFFKLVKEHFFNNYVFSHHEEDRKKQEEEVYKTLDKIYSIKDINLLSNLLGKEVFEKVEQQIKKELSEYLKLEKTDKCRVMINDLACNTEDVLAVEGELRKIASVFGYNLGVVRKKYESFKRLIEKKRREKEERESKLESKPLEIGTLNITNYIDNVKIFYQRNPFFYNNAGLFWFWDNQEVKWKIVDEIDVMNAIDKALGFGGQTVNAKIKGAYLESFKRVGRANTPKDAPKSWIQFKSQIYDFKTKKLFKATPEYFICNPIPWDIGKSEETPTIDKLFKEWVGEDYVKTLYEIVAYCCVTDYPIHTLFCFIGTGRNGKTQFQVMLAKFIGKDNVSCTELDSLIDNRFESTRLFKKLVCMMGETNFGVISKTSMLKKLTGQDLVGYEYKNKNLFDDYNYAKIIINSNSLPSTEDTSEGFYRRWMIIDFPNIFKEGKSIVETIPEEEYSNLANKILKIIPELIERGEFSNQGSIEERKHKYILASNPLPFFLDIACKKGFDLHVRYSELYIAYIKFLSLVKRRVVSKKEFGKSLETESLEARRSNHKNESTGLFESSFYVEGIDLKPKWEEELLQMLPSLLKFTLPPRVQAIKMESEHKGNESNKISQNYGKEGEKQLILEEIDVESSTGNNLPPLVPMENIEKNQSFTHERVEEANAKSITEESKNEEIPRNPGDLEVPAHASGSTAQNGKPLKLSYIMPDGSEHEIELSRGMQGVFKAIELIQEDNAAYIDELFDKSLIEHLKQSGEIAEVKAGTYIKI